MALRRPEAPPGVRKHGCVRLPTVPTLLTRARNHEDPRMNVETPTSGRLTADAVAALNDPEIPATFVQNLFGRVPVEDLAPYTPRTLAGLAMAAYEHLKAPRPGGADLRLGDLRLVDLEIEHEGRRKEV